MNELTLTIVTPAGHIFSGTVTSLSAPGLEGGFGVLAHHAPMVTQLREGVVTVRSAAGVEYFAVSSGVLEVNQKSEVVLLADDAEKSGDIDKAYENVKTFAQRRKANA